MEGHGASGCASGGPEDEWDETKSDALQQRPNGDV